MTRQPQATAVVTPQVQEAREHEAFQRRFLSSQAVDVLTRAARLTRTMADGGVEPDDFPDFLANALAPVAANLGDPYLVTAGRPGSWEADLVEQLVTGTVGFDSAFLLHHRTEPVVVPLNVAQLVEDTGGLLSFFDAEQALPFSLDVDEQTREGDWDRLRGRYLDAYDAYAKAFTAAVLAHALSIDGLTARPSPDAEPELVVRVVVRAHTEPDQLFGEVENPVEWEGDPLVWRLWKHAVDTVGLPVLSGEGPEAA